MDAFQLLEEVEFIVTTLRKRIFVVFCFLGG